MTAIASTTNSPHWSAAPADPRAVAEFSAATGLSSVTATILLSRGITTAEDARRFLEPSLERDWVESADIPGMDEAAARVAVAIRGGERIVVFGDFDLDGISSAALATLGIAALGGSVEATVPHRFREGYGLTEASMSRLAAMKPDLVVTVDCGISSAAEVSLLAGQGIDVVVTDHHEPGEGVPDGVPVANPKLAAGGPALAGAGVALVLVQTVGALLGRPDAWHELTDLATLGTVADIVPLVGPNRALVTDGLARTRATPRPGIAALAEVAAVPTASLTAEHVAFALAPRLNAAGRMAEPAAALDLLMTRDPERALELARGLDEHNRLRQAVEADLYTVALAQAEEAFRDGDRVVVVAGEGWHEGVRGIVASRLVTRFGVPALVLSIDGDEAQGSGRSIEGADLHAALTRLESMLTRFGGHAMAIGVTLPTRALDTLRAALAEWARALPGEIFVPRVAIDAEVSLDALSRDLAAEIALLGPFGFANRRPLLAARGVFMSGRRRVGKAEDHLSFTAYDGVAEVRAIAFRAPEIERLAATDTAVDVAFELDVDEWRGVERVRMLARHVRVRDAGAHAGAATLVEDLFAHADEILARGEYAGIEDAGQFHTKLAGVTFEGRQSAIARLVAGMPLRIEREPANPHDANACAVFDPFGDQVGFLNRRLAAVLAPVLDAGVEYDLEVADVTGGADGASLGVNVLVSRRAGETPGETSAAERAAERREELRAMEAADRDAELVRHFIGDRSLHAAQTEALGHLAAGRPTLAVMATGRGKSLVFHIHAAREAIVSGRASVFVYPLRALVADQAFHLEERFAELGCAVRTVTGETSPGGRDEAFGALADGSLDVVLTTPEFLDHHAARFADCGRVGFVVVDEAHHVGLSRAGHRPAYARLDSALRTLGDPLVLAVTATAPTDVAEAIRSTLGVHELVLDPTTRENLRIVDRRGASDKPAVVSSLAATGEKVIVYVNSRDVSVRLARQLRTAVPDLDHRVAFYNGGMNRESRHAVERAFREGDITVVVATSAFGEGVDIPDVRHVVLYHLPMGEVEFNQICGRCGRDGAPASVHLVFGPSDARLNRMILESAAPPRDDLAALYLALKDLGADGADAVEITNAELAERVKARRPGSGLSDKGVSTGIGVFRELGLVTSEGAGAYRRLVLLPAPETKLDLTSSVRYTEGLDELESFEGFRARALEATADELLHAFNRPILPTRHQPES